MAFLPPPPQSKTRPDIAIFLYGATSGGAPRRALTLAREFAKRGFEVDWVVANPDAPLAERVPENVRAVALDGVVSKWAALRRRKPLALRAAIPALGRYLSRENPRVLLSAANSAHFSAFLAHRISRSGTKLALRICTHLSGGTAGTSRAPRPVAAARNLLHRLLDQDSPSISEVMSQVETVGLLEIELRKRIIPTLN